MLRWIVILTLLAQPLAVMAACRCQCDEEAMQAAVVPKDCCIEETPAPREDACCDSDPQPVTDEATFSSICQCPTCSAAATPTVQAVLLDHSHDVPLAEAVLDLAPELLTVPCAVSPHTVARDIPPPSHQVRQAQLSVWLD